MPCLPPVKDWIDYFGALTPVCITAFGAWIAWQQFRTNRDKLRLDLYQRRFHVYEATLSFYQALLGSPEDLKMQEFDVLHKEFIKSCREAKFLFDPDVVQLLEQFSIAGSVVVGFRLEGANMRHVMPTFLELNKASNDAMSSLGKLIFVLEDAIFPYLNFRKITNHPLFEFRKNK